MDIKRLRIASFLLKTCMDRRKMIKKCFLEYNVVPSRKCPKTKNSYSWIFKCLSDGKMTYWFSITRHLSSADCKLILGQNNSPCFRWSFSRSKAPAPLYLVKRGVDCTMNEFCFHIFWSRIYSPSLIFLERGLGGELN